MIYAPLFNWAIFTKMKRMKIKEFIEKHFTWKKRLIELTPLVMKIIYADKDDKFLSEYHYQLLLLFLVEKLSFKEIGKRWEINQHPIAVKWRLREAYYKLQELKDENKDRNVTLQLQN